MYKFYMIPDATTLSSHADIYDPTNMKLFWDPYSESDAYGAVEPLWKEEINKADSIEFTVLPTNIHYNDFHKNKTVVIMFDEDTWLYEGVVSDAPVDFFKQRKVTVTGAFSYLCNSVQGPDERTVSEVSTADTETRYLPVPESWYAGASPRELNWYEQNIANVYEEVEQTDVFQSGVTYYKLQNNAYTVYSATEANWDSRPQLYILNGQEALYTASTDNAANVSKTYYYEFSGDGKNYTGMTTTGKAPKKETLVDHIKRLLNVHNAQVDPFKRIYPGQMYSTTDTELHEFKSSNYRMTWDALKSDILDDYGRYFTITRGQDNNLYLNYLELTQLPQATDALIEFANNMIEMNEADNKDDDIFSVIVPIGKNNLTVAKAIGHDSPASNTAEISPYIASFGGNRRYVVVSPKAVSRHGHIFKTVSFGDISNPDKLYASAVKYIQTNYDFHTEYEVKAVDLKLINGTGHRIRIGDRVRVHSKWHGVDINELYVISAEHDLVSPENDSYKIGIPNSDKEASNKRLTGQSNKTKSSSAAGYSSAQAAIDSFASKLSALMEITEWGIKAHTRIENKVEDASGMYLTKFLQNEYDINLIAQKIFGPEFQDDQMQDAGYIRVPVTDYKNANGTYKDPTKELWYEYVYDNNLKKYVYKRSVKDTCNPAEWPDAVFYIQRLWTRYSEIDVGPNGIKGRVDGNYERSVANSSWINLNEDSITALTGHLFVDEETGHVYVTSGSGMRVDHQEERTEPKYELVSPSRYKDANGNDVKPYWENDGEQWYEQKTDSSGKWLGQDQDDALSNDNYFQQSADETVDRSKRYYDKIYIREEFNAKFGIYDEDNLTAGILVRTINNPLFKRVYVDEVKAAIRDGVKLGTLGWYEYDANTGMFGLPLPENQNKVPSRETYEHNIGYWRKVSNIDSYTGIMGDHVVIGGRLDANGDPLIYDGVDDATQARIQQYVSGRNLDGTITEIASDVLYAKAIITNYMNVLSTKIFGSSNDDGDFVKIKNANVHSDKNPSEEGWYERRKKTAEELAPGESTDSYIYYLSADSEADDAKAYYITKLVSRVTDFVAGEGGLHATITGNLERSIASQSWIEANEEKLNLLLGHIGTDADGNLVIDAGAGLRTGYSSATDISPKYVLVDRSEYSNANPKTKGWYERKTDVNGQWNGSGKSDWQTNGSYYVSSNDTEANYTKRYYKKSTTAETFVSEYGIYDQSNLTAGVIAQVVNNPKYFKVAKSLQTAANIANPSQATNVVVEKNGVLSTINSQWYVYDSTNHTWGRTTDTSWESDYYYVDNNMSAFTDIYGDHIRIGPSTTPATIDPDDRQSETLANRITRYVGDHHLNGTICEIASDVVSVNSLFAKYIETEYLVSENNQLGTIYADSIMCRNNIQCQGGDVLVNVGSKYFPGGRSLSSAIESFGTATYDGDNVSIPFYTVSNPNIIIQGNPATASGTLTFTKPASLGTVTWSSGATKTLSVYTAGGRLFFNADLNIPWAYSSPSYQQKGQNFEDIPSTIPFNNKPTLKTTVSISGTWTDESHDPSEDDPVVWTKDIFIDASAAYENGVTDGMMTSSHEMSLGEVIWGSSETLTLKTFLGTTYFHADLDIPWAYTFLLYNRKGQDFPNIPSATLFQNKPTLMAQVDVTGTWTGETHDPSEDDPLVWRKNIYIDASGPYEDGWNSARGKMSWPSSMQALGEHAQIQIGYPDSTVDSSASTTFTMVDADTKGTTGYVKLYRDYIDADHRGSLVGAIDVSDWYTEGWRKANLKMDWPAAMQTIGERTSLTIKYPASNAGYQESTSFRLIEDPKGTSGYVRVYRDYVNDSDLGSLIGAIQVGDWYTTGWNNAYGQLQWPTAMQAIGERTNFNILYPNSTAEGSQNTASFRMIADEIGTNGYVKLYRDYIDSAHPGSLYAAVNVGDWYSQGITDAKAKIGFYGPGIASNLTPAEESDLSNQSALAYNTVYEIYSTYDGSKYGNRKLFKTPSNQHDAGESDGRTGTTISSPSAGSAPQGTSVVDLSAYNTTYEVHKMFNGANDGGAVYFKTPRLGDTRTYYERLNNEDEWEGTTLSNNNTITLNYGEIVNVRGRHQDGFNSWHEGYVLSVTAPSNNQGSGETAGRIGTSISSPATTTAPEGASVVDLSANTTYEVHKIFNGVNDGGTVYFKTPANQSVSHNIDIPSSRIYTKDSPPNGGQLLTKLRNTYEEAKADGDYVVFEVTCGGTTKVYYMAP